MSEEIQSQEKPIEVAVTPDQAFQLKIQELEKGITAAEAQVAQLKAQRAAYIFDTNIKSLQEANRKPEEKSE